MSLHIKNMNFLFMNRSIICKAYQNSYICIENTNNNEPLIVIVKNQIRQYSLASILIFFL